MEHRDIAGGLSRLLEGRTPGLMDATGRYAVLVPLVERKDGWYLLYEVRARSMRRQPGEVCFPGGRMEGAESPEACALRETEEELSIPPSAVRILGRLDFIAHRANFIMYPILALVDAQAVEHMTLNPGEVDETFLVPVRHLLETEPLEYSYQLIPQPVEGFPYELIGIPRDYRWQPGGENVPVYPWEGHAIWGLTGRITRHLVALLREMGPEQETEP
ncbi:CoA pyrophosphatase [Pseudoflavonifractor sp. AF19-9AC]|uniref:NUDIX hydrolase n=1 Tax=Pseudoflavonifractor sp. AF19-9AC TaxID=2292244 RepID=UPI000E503E93|nr:CoA pyrophosphatase [Pseudoflavonifractor sp. AF19-9AC]RHR11091.1 CoA pyrophosphatase [Pseudoflavonifractor sp. AF19-9AC]